MKTRVCLKYFVDYCSILDPMKRQTFLFKRKQPPEFIKEMSRP